MRGGATNYILLAIPFFFLAIGLELLLARLQKKAVYRVNDALADLSCGVINQLLGVFLAGAISAGYLYLYHQHRVTTLSSSSVVVWVSLFLGVDFFYYWFHRASHRVACFWAAHVVHHQSEDYNLAVALRQAAFQPAISWMFYLPLALLGFPPPMFAAMLSFNTLYQFWIHTRLIRRMGPLEWVLNTPSHHRVHHGVEPKYIDKNHGGTLIVWDRLFGTFQAEEEEPTYGTSKALASWNPVYANFEGWQQIAKKVRRARSWGDRLRAFWAPPGFVPRGVVVEDAPLLPGRAKFDPPVSRATKTYALVQFVPSIPGTMMFLMTADQLLSFERLAFFGAILLTLVSVGALLERRRYAPLLELARFLVLVGWILVARIGGDAGAIFAIAFAALSLGWLSAIKPSSGTAYSPRPGTSDCNR